MAPVRWLFLLISVCTVVAVMAVVWLRGRYVTVELARDTGVSAAHPARAVVAGLSDAPPMVQFLELQYPGQIREVLLLWRRGAVVEFIDGRVQLFGRNGEPADEPFDPDTYRRLRLGAAEPPL